MFISIVLSISIQKQAVPSSCPKTRLPLPTSPSPCNVVLSGIWPNYTANIHWQGKQNIAANAMRMIISSILPSITLNRRKPRQNHSRQRTLFNAARRPSRKNSSRLNGTKSLIQLTFFKKSRIYGFMPITNQRTRQWKMCCSRTSKQILIEVAENLKGKNRLNLDWQYIEKCRTLQNYPQWSDQGQTSTLIHKPLFNIVGRYSFLYQRL